MQWETKRNKKIRGTSENKEKMSSKRKNGGKMSTKMIKVIIIWKYYWGVGMSWVWRKTASIFAHEYRHNIFKYILYDLSQFRHLSIGQTSYLAWLGECWIMIWIIIYMYIKHPVQAVFWHLSFYSVHRVWHVWDFSIAEIRIQKDNIQKNTAYKHSTHNSWVWQTWVSVTIRWLAY